MPSEAQNSSYDDLIKSLEEVKEVTSYRPRTQRDKLRALRDEFGFQPTTPRKEDDNE